MAEPKPNQIITCPYDTAHQVEHYRMHVHLQKCRKQHPNSKKVSCPFDSTHVVNDVELDYHVTTCGKRIMLDVHQFAIGDMDERQVLPVVNNTTIQMEENWDDVNVTTYKPDLTKKAAHIITKVKGATPSERRKARMEGIKNYKPPE